MKKLLLTFVAAWTAAGLVLGGGIVTNTNQSAAWVRMPVRDASQTIDAVYYNPAGLFKLNDGFSFSINNQYITQKQEVDNSYTGPDGITGLNNSLYKGSVLAPVFPGVYAVYKKNKIAVSFGFNPIGGGGGATFDKGLPSFELTPSDMWPTLRAYGATGYRMETYFKGSSIFFGFQLGVSYKINDMISVFAGARYVMAKNTYEGYLRKVEVNMAGAGGTWTEVSDVFQGLGDQAKAGGDGATSISGTMNTLINTYSVPSGFTLMQAQGAGALTEAQRLALVGGCQQLGIDTAMNLGQIQATATGTAAYLYSQDTIAYGKSALTALLFNQEAKAGDIVQTGSGITPILGVDLTFGKLDIGIKYEFITKMDMVNKTKAGKDFTTGLTPLGVPITMFPDGQKVPSDMPAMLSVGLNYGATEKLTIAVGGHYYWDKTANYGSKLNDEFVKNDVVIDNNFYEIAGGLEYKLTDKLMISGGYLRANTGVNSDYQSDLSFSLSTNTIGLGGAYNITENMRLNLGAAYTQYEKQEKILHHTFMATGAIYTPKETYWKNTMIFSAGLDFSF
jgi:long-chain fatty acid transport protein